MKSQSSSQSPPRAKENKVLVAMSGGMCSSVTAALLKSEGYAVTGLHLRLMGEDSPGFASHCARSASEEKAKAACARLDIPFKTLDAAGAFDHEVVDLAVHEFLQARRPHPCVQCHQKIKIGLLDRYARENGFPLIATGHFARITRDPRTGIPLLQRAVDVAQDQSFFLYGVSPQVLTRMLLPLGGISRAMIAKLARQFDIPDADLSVTAAAESEICFGGSEADHAFILKRSEASVRPRGIIRTPEGKVLGEHDGLFRYGLGERRKELEKGSDDQEFVVGYESNPMSVIVGPESLLALTEIFAADARWIRAVEGVRALRCKARLGRVGEEIACRVTFFENRAIHVFFEKPRKDAVPGRPIVFYDGEEVLGGATIDRLGPSVGLRKR